MVCYYITYIALDPLAYTTVCPNCQQKGHHPPTANILWPPRVGGTAAFLSLPCRSNHPALLSHSSLDKLVSQQKTVIGLSLSCLIHLTKAAI